MKAYLLVCLIAVSTFSFAQGPLPWQQVHNIVPWPNAQYVFASDSDYVYAYSTENNSGRLYRSAAKGDPGSWVELTNDPGDMTGWGCQLYKSGKYLYLLEGICYTARLFRSADNGLTWTQPDTSFGRSYYIGTLAFLDSGPIIAVKLSWDPAFYRSTDNGNSWTKVYTLPINYMTAYYNFIEKNGVTYFICDSTVLVSTDAGATWTDLHARVPAWGQTVLLSDGTFMMYSGGLLYTSSDAITWTVKQSAGIPAIATLPEQFVKSLNSDSLFLIATDYNTAHYLLYSADAGATWSSFDAGITLSPLVMNNYWVYRLHPSRNGYMYVSPQAGGIYRTGGVGTSIASFDSKAGALNVYPNPADDKLNISISRDLQGSCNITVTDVTGRGLITQALGAGKGPHLVQLDIASLPPGIYTVSIRAGNGTEVRKFVKR
jgi:photosystem II stability/assembly factor-like uncharacterized protein